MELVMTDSGFIPSLAKRGLTDKSKELVVLWNMQDQGLPVPGREGYKTALWYGRRISRYGEFAILCVSVEIQKPVVDFSADWYCGFAEESLLNEPLELPSFARVRSSTINGAISDIELFLPRSHFQQPFRSLH